MRSLTYIWRDRGPALILAFALLGTFCFRQQTSAQNAPWTSGETDARMSSFLECSVVDATGAPLRDVAVQLMRLEGLMHLSVVYTDLRGMARFDPLPIGLYQVTATLGTSTTVEHIKVDAIPQPIVIVLRSHNAGTGSVSGQKTVPVQQLLVPRNATKEFGKAETAFVKGDDSKAFTHVERALSICPTYAQALALRGTLRLIQGKRDTSSEDLELAIRYDPGLVKAYFMLANIYNDKHEFGRAGNLATQAKVLDPQSWQGYYESARSNLGRGDFEAALKDAQEAERLVPDKFKAATILAQTSALIGTGNDADAAAVLQELLKRQLTESESELAKRFLSQLSH